MYFHTAYFFVFPGCFASGWRHSAAGPCAAGGRAASNANIQKYLLIIISKDGKISMNEHSV